MEVGKAEKKISKDIERAHRNLERTPRSLRIGAKKRFRDEERNSVVEYLRKI